MKKSTKILALLLTVALLIGICAVSTFAASGYAGQTVSLTFSFPNVNGADGSISYSNPSLFSNISASTSQGSVSQSSLYLYGGSKGTYSFKLSFKLAANAKVGDSCTVTVRYRTTDADGTLSDWQTTSQTVTVASKPVTPVANLTELQKQITIAESLSQPGYTTESWNALQTALRSAKAVNANSAQTTVDTAAKNLADAIAALVKMDYSKLQAALTEAATISSSSALNASLTNFIDSLKLANEMLSSGSQSAVDNAANALLAAIAELKAALGDLTQTTIVEVPGETVYVNVPGETVYVEVPGETVTVEVPVDPTEPFCNIGSHTVWMILCIIFIVITVACVAYIIFTFVKKKQNRKDNTPLVKYNIEDDDN